MTDQEMANDQTRKSDIGHWSLVLGHSFGHWCLVIPLAFSLLMSFACQPKPQEIKPRPTAPELFEQGLQLLQQKKYDKAAETFQRITFEYATTRYAADAQFYLAESYLDAKNYDQAAIEYQFLTTNYPTSPFFEEAMYKSILCTFRQAPAVSLDQSGLKSTLDQIDLFRERYPDSKWLAEINRLEGEVFTRLARKEYDSGVLYAKAGVYESARVYFEHVIGTYPKASIIPEVRFQLAICYEFTDRQKEARDIYQDLSTGEYDSLLKKQAAERLANLK